MKSRSATQKEEWVKYLDEETNQYYWYSNKTGESKWADEQILDYNDNTKTDDGLELIGQVHEENIEDTMMERRNPAAHDYSDDEDEHDGGDGNYLFGNRLTSQTEGDYHGRSLTRPVDYVESDDEIDQHLQSETDELLVSQLIDRDILYRTKRDITIFTYCFIIHAVLIEAPFCVLESGIRCLIFLFCGFFFLFLYILSIPLSICLSKSKSSVSCSTSPLPPLLRVSLLSFFESLMSFALGLSLAIPCCILLIYRDFNGVDEWNLHPVPSFLGWLDPRRLAMISLGQGAAARNSCLLHSPFQQPHGSAGAEAGGAVVGDVLDSIVPPSILLPTEYPSIFSSPLCFPREILFFLRSMR